MEILRGDKNCVHPNQAFHSHPAATNISYSHLGILATRKYHYLRIKLKKFTSKPKAWYKITLDSQSPKMKNETDSLLNRNFGDQLPH